MDINTLARFLSNTDTSSLTAANLLILVNKEYERITGKIIAETANGKWQYGDANYSAFPTYTMNLVNGQQAYQIDSLTTPLLIMGIEVLDNSGNNHLLQPITLSEIHARGIAQPEYYKTNGRPRYYEKREHMIALYPAPDNGVSVTLANGLRIFFLRTADTFTSAQVTTGTKEPGFPSPWHDILAYGAALTYCEVYKPEKVSFLSAEREQREKELLNFIARRNSDDRKILNNRQPFYR